MGRPPGFRTPNRKTDEMIGKRYSMLLVIADGPQTPDHVARVMVRCDCGVEKLMPAKNIRSGRAKSCGCYRHISGVIRNTTHNMTGTRIHRIWANMLTRCRNSKSSHYNIYGGAGVTVCNRWLSFENFLEDMGHPPTNKHSIDRFPDKDGNYEPSNCRWATQTEQNRNKHNNRLLTLNGETMTLVEWSERTGIGVVTLSSRVGKLGWSDARALTTPCKGRGSNGRN